MFKKYHSNIPRIMNVEQFNSTLNLFCQQFAETYLKNFERNYGLKCYELLCIYVNEWFAEDESGKLDFTKFFFWLATTSKQKRNFGIMVFKIINIFN